MREVVARLAELLEGISPRTAIVLGSGLGGLAERLIQPRRISYAHLPGFPESGVSGHGGELVAGILSERPVMLLSGRAHYYERGDPAAMRVPLQVLKATGVRRLILTNSAGSLREDMPPGSVMMIADHINWSGRNPLIGVEGDERFADLTNAYSRQIMNEFRRSAQEAGHVLHEGVYMWFSGPSFETPAEIRAARILGADAVGMSTVPEVILASYLKLECAAFSVITNFGAGMAGSRPSHEETRRMAPQGGKLLADLVAATLGRMDE